MVAGVSLLLVVFLVVYGVILRYAFRSPASWSIELPTFLFLIIVAFGLAYVHRLRGHIGVDIVVTRLSRRARTVLGMVGSLSVLIYAGIVAWASCVKAWHHVQYGERSDVLGIPLGTLQAVLAIGLLLFCLQALAEIKKDMAKLRAKRGRTDDK